LTEEANQFLKTILILNKQEAIFEIQPSFEFSNKNRGRKFTGKNRKEFFGRTESFNYPAKENSSILQSKHSGIKKLNPIQEFHIQISKFSKRNKIKSMHKEIFNSQNSEEEI